MRQTLGSLLLCAVLVIAAAIRFSHAALTETQLFVQFWWAWLALGVVAGLGLRAARVIR